MTDKAISPLRRRMIEDIPYLRLKKICASRQTESLRASDGRD